MNQSSFRSAFFVLLLLIFHAAAGAAQESSGGQADGSSDSNANVVLGGVTGSPGEQVMVPIYLRPPEAVAVGSLKLDITFVSVNLKFEKIEPGIAAEMGNVDVKSELKTGKNDKDVETSTLAVTATAPAAGSDKKGIPAGLLAYITLRISDKGRPATIGLQTKLEATEFGTNQKLVAMRASDASVLVVAPGTEPAVSCFFFTH